MPADRAVVLVSGGLDSATTLAIARDRGFDCHALTFDYGQRHLHELDAARRVASHLGAIEHRLVSIDLRQFGGSALTTTIDVPKGRSIEEMGAGVPITYVPARNTIMLAVALGFAEVLEAKAIFIGVNAIDYSGYPDCRPEFIEAFQAMANLATRMGIEGDHVTIHAPLQELSKGQIITTGMALGVDYAQTISCYDPDEGGDACRRCDACQLRAAGFREAGHPDPALEGRDRP